MRSRVAAKISDVSWLDDDVIHRVGGAGGGACLGVMLLSQEL